MDSGEYVADSGPRGAISPTQLPLIVMVAPTIPPVHGMSLVAQRAGARFAEAGCEIVWLSRNPPGLTRGLRYFASVLSGVARSSWRSMRLRRRSSKAVYVACSGGWGVLAEGLCVGLLRRRREPLVVHHHNFGYLVERSVAFQMVLRTIYRGAHHIVLCDHMADLLVSRGVDRNEVAVVSNATFVDRPTNHHAAQTKPTPRLRLGHLSNLSVDKGLKLLIDILEDGPGDVTLVLYGSTSDTTSTKILEDALTRLAGRLQHIKPTNRESVWQFYQAIDLFLFPSRNDAAPLVVLEALAAGTPVVATDSGCIPSQLSPHLHDLSVSLGSYRARTAEVIRRMREDHGFRTELNARAEEQWTHLRTTSEVQFQKVLARLGVYTAAG